MDGGTDGQTLIHQKNKARVLLETEYNKVIYKIINQEDT